MQSVKNEFTLLASVSLPVAVLVALRFNLYANKHFYKGS